MPSILPDNPLPLQSPNPPPVRPPRPVQKNSTPRPRGRYKTHPMPFRAAIRTLCLCPLALGLLALALSAAPASAFYFRLDGDRLWLQADRTPLSDVLAQFSRAGVEVWADPDLAGTLTGAIRGEELSDGLDRILDRYDYLLSWRLLPGPLGKVPKLQSIRVFTPGRASSARRLPPARRDFDPTRGVTGRSPEFMRDELLLAVRPGTTYDQFSRLLDQIGGMLVDAQDGVYLVRFPPGTNVEALLGQLRRQPLIAHAELNYAIRLPSPVSPSPAANLPSVSPPSDGTIPVAVLDSGLDLSSPAASVASAAWNALDPDETITDPVGHGTQMALLASGAATADGWAPAASALPVVAVRTFDERGVTSDFALLQALAYAKKAGARVVNMSWGSDTPSDFVASAIRQAADSGLILVAAAGNGAAPASAYYPAAYDGVLAVAGTSPDGTPWTGSSTGPYVDLSAPATRTTVTDRTVTSLAGTSVSSAAVAGAIARWLNAHPTATSADAVSALRASLSPSVGEGYGNGTLDAAALARYLGGAAP